METKWGDREARQRDILAAGRRLLTERGFAALQMRDVARGAGISAGTVYTYFPTKEALYAALYTHRLREFVATVEPLCVTAQDPVELFIAVATEHRDMYREYGRELDLFGVLAGDIDMDPAIGGPLLLAAARVYDLMIATVDRMLSGRNRIGDSGMAVALMWATITGLADQFGTVRHYLHSRSWEEIVRFAAHTLVLGLTAGND